MGTIKTIKSVIKDLGYTLVEPKVLSYFLSCSAKRERLMLVGIRNDLVKSAEFNWPSPYKKIMVMRDALQAGELYPNDVLHPWGKNTQSERRNFKFSATRRLLARFA